MARTCPGRAALPGGAAHERPVPPLTISGSLLAAGVVRNTADLPHSRAAQIVTSGTGRRALGARGAAVGTALLRAFARHRMTRG